MTTLYELPYETLVKRRDGLQTQKMKLDKFFSVFLAEKTFPEEDYTTDEWKTYKEMLKLYNRTDEQLKILNYKIANYV